MQKLSKSLFRRYKFTIQSMTKEIPIILSSASHPKFKFKGMSLFERDEGMEFFKAEVEHLQSITGD